MTGDDIIDITPEGREWYLRRKIRNLKADLRVREDRIAELERQLESARDLACRRLIEHGTARLDS